MNIDQAGRNLTNNELQEIQELVDNAINASNKKSANQFINRLDFMQRSLYGALEPYDNNVFSEFIGYVKAASGQVQNKGHWISAVNQSLYKLESQSRIQATTDPDRESL